ncbi:hypothetical protein EPA93_05160 [Ktedonosporobacter rubrisoli]|uniref:Uncharacterized protein n=1 Tax=Ktedonosporobacter rubrisoli TaxID=2509675 RepID=A0A4P6JIC2_KTERU|nr:hypothetical protein [Ktedonosporobacter rubrisoli]QBD74805.1 hypothetical protein EPA93_01860 [Ktedonosporobacter rubrisoli]QBD75422.1 hypothetical protein EPA93_05160 [Ktedonosporobacter rubrisoli]
MEMKSEVARLREQIALECEAVKRGLSGYACVGQHEFVRQKYAAIETHYQKLVPLVGQEEAAEITFETYKDVLQR